MTLCGNGSWSGLFVQAEDNYEGPECEMQDESKEQTDEDSATEEVPECLYKQISACVNLHWSLTTNLERCKHAPWDQADARYRPSNVYEWT